MSSPNSPEEKSSDEHGLEVNTSKWVGRKLVKLAVASLLALAAAKYAPQLLPAAIKDLAEISTSL